MKKEVNKTDPENYIKFHDPSDYEFIFRKDYQPVHVGHKELFRDYSHPCWDLSCLEKNIVIRPYVPKEKINCDHKYSLDYKTWANIVKSLCKYYLEYLLTGFPLELPSRMGSLQMKKWNIKKANNLDVVASQKEGKAIFNKYPETLHYSPLFKWNRRHNVNLAYKYFWKVNLTKTAWKRVSQELQKDFSTMDRFIDA